MSSEIFIVILSAIFAFVAYQIIRKSFFSRKLRRSNNKDMTMARPNDGVVSDPEALEEAEKQIQDSKSLMETYARQGYYVLRTFGSSEGFSSTYVYDMLKRIKDEGLRAEIIESNGSLVGLETGNFMRYELLAHVDDADKVKGFLQRQFLK